MASEKYSGIRKWQPNSEYLSTLMELGISEKKAIKALKVVNNSSVDSAATYVFENIVTSSSDDDNNDDNIGSSNENINDPVDLQLNNENYLQNLDQSEMVKMVFIVNCSLKMNTGKIAAQVAHAAVDLFSKTNIKNPIFNIIWQQYGQTKIVLRGDNENELINLEKLAKNTNSIFTTIIHDAGKTEIAPNSLTCVGLYGRVAEVDKITGHLQLLKTCTKCE